MRGWWARQRVMLADPRVRFIVRIVFWTWLATTAFMVGILTPDGPYQFWN